ncbi:uncharacterized protein LOC132683884 isoform X2 [Panthera onca]
MTFMRPRDFSLDRPLSPLKKGRKITIALIKEAFLLLGQNSFSKELDLTIGPPGYGQGEGKYLGVELMSNMIQGRKKTRRQTPDYV